MYIVYIENNLVKLISIEQHIYFDEQNIYKYECRNI